MRIALIPTVLLVLLCALACGDDDIIYPVPEALAFSPATLPPGTVGVAYDETVTVSHQQTPVGGMDISDGSPPPGLELHRELGAQMAAMRGTPSQAGTFTFTVHAWCYGTMRPGQTGEKRYTIEIVAP